MTALADLRVLEAGSGIVPSVVGMFFGDFGADVVKVEPPGGDPYRRRRGFAVYNRNKRSRIVDPASAADAAWLAASLRGADVVILGAGQSLASLGADAVAAAAANPRLVVLELPPFLAGHSPWGDVESNLLLSGYGAQATRQSSNSGGPIDSTSPFMLYIHAAWAAACAVAALVERETSGLGQVVTVGGMNGIEVGTVGALTVDPNLPPVPTDIGVIGRHFTYRQFRTKDGWVSSGALGAKFEERILRALGLGWLVDHERVGGITARLLSPDNFAWARDAIEDAFASRTSAEVLGVIAGVGIPAGLVADRDDWLDDEQLRAIGMVAEVDDPERGRVTMGATPFVLTKTPGSIRTPAPRAGEHGGDAPWEPQQEAPSAAGPRYVPGPLRGLRVLNMGTFVAGPMAGMLLSELGAEVVKVEPIGGDPFRQPGYTYNRGMKSICLDLASERGRAAFHALAKEADVVADSMRPGVMRKLGIDYEALSATNPSIITTSLSGFGEGGPLSSLPLVDMVVQAQSGMMSSLGGDDEPVANTIAINDVTTAALSALMITVAFYHRKRTGEGQRAWNALVGAATYLQLEDLVRFDGAPAPRRGSRDFRGPGPLESFHRAADGWIGVDASGLTDAEQRAALAELGTDAPSLGGWIATREADRAVAALLAAGVPAARARDVVEVLRDPVLLARDVITYGDAADGTVIAAPASFARFERTQRTGPQFPSGIGEHTRELLRRSGFDDEAAESLIAEGAAQAGGAVVHQLAAAYR